MKTIATQANIFKFTCQRNSFSGRCTLDHNPCAVIDVNLLRPNRRHRDGRSFTVLINERRNEKVLLFIEPLPAVKSWSLWRQKKFEATTVPLRNRDGTQSRILFRAAVEDGWLNCGQARFEGTQRFGK